VLAIKPSLFACHNWVWVWTVGSGNPVSSLDPVLFLFLVCIAFACAKLAFFCTVPRLPNNYSCNSEQSVSSDVLARRRTSAVVSSFGGEEFGDKKNPTDEGLKSCYTHHSFCAALIFAFYSLTVGLMFEEMKENK
jgi:hypothetical protein